MEILERLDKGMDDTKILHPDLRAQNVHITDDNAGIIDVGVLLKTPVPKVKTRFLDKPELKRLKVTGICIAYFLSRYRLWDKQFEIF